MVAATLNEIRLWYKHGEAQGATHMIVVCDTYDYEDYPVYVSPGESVAQKLRDQEGNMRQVMEVYDFRLGWESQSKEQQAWHVNEAAPLTVRKVTGL